MIIAASAAAHAAKVEAQRREAEVHQRLRDAKYRFGVHRSAVDGMWMAHDGDHSRRAIPGRQAIGHAQQPFEEAVRSGYLDRLKLWHALRFLTGSLDARGRPVAY
jgi:hypothetical protein